jgi:hypothetical protein
MSAVLGTSLYVFLGVTLFLGGGAAWLMGQALGGSWRPLWQVLLYSLLLGLSDRFITYALFDGELLSPTGFVIDTGVIAAVGLAAFRVSRVSAMVRQYPWLFERFGPFAWRTKRAGAAESPAPSGATHNGIADTNARS